MDLTVVLTNFKRPANLRLVIDALDAQTLRPTIFLWNNGEPFVDPRIDWIVNSSKNALCGVRWSMAAYATTPWTLIMDDDLIPKDNRVLMDTVDKLEHHQTAVGAVGVKLRADQTYHRSDHLGYPGRDKRVLSIESDRRVEIIKGRYFALSTARIKTLPPLPYCLEDDIIVSHAVGGGHILKCLQTRFTELPQGDEAVNHQPNHRGRREEVRRQLFG